MIIPYYNSILIAQSAEFDREGKVFIKECLVQYLTQKIQQYLLERSYSQNQNKTLQVSIQRLSLVQQKEYQAQSQFHLDDTLRTLQPLLYPLQNQTYTTSLQDYQYFTALKSLDFQQKSKNSPIVLHHLSRLQAFFKKYRRQMQIKDFIKILLVDEINHQRKMIKYRALDQVKGKVSELISSIKGNIRIHVCLQLLKPSKVYNNQQEEHKNTFFFIYLGLNNNKSKDLLTLIRQVQSQVTIDKTTNKKITDEYTNSLINKLCRQRIQIFFTRYVSNYYKIFKHQMKQFKKTIKTIYISRTMFKYGNMLHQAERQQRQQFLKFVQQMTDKYTKECNNYLVSFRQQLLYSKKQKKYCLGLQSSAKIVCYFKSFKTFLKYKKDRDQLHENKCRMIQTRIKSYLICNKLYRACLEGYLDNKKRQKIQFDQSYSKMIRLNNQSQLKKYSGFNKYKYGLTAYLHILSIENYHNEETYSPENVLSLVERLSKCQEPIVNINCSKKGIRVSTIEGRIIKLQYCSDSNKNQRYNEKQNIRNSMNNSHLFQSNLSNNLTYRSNTQSSLNSHNTSKISYESSKHLQEKLQFKINNKSKQQQKRCNQLGSYKKRLNDDLWKFVHENAKIVQDFKDTTFIITKDNRLFHCGHSYQSLPQTSTPIQYKICQKMNIKQLLVSSSQIYILTDQHKVYSLFAQKYIRIPKEAQMGLSSFHIIRTASKDIEIVYLLGYQIKTIDKIRQKQIKQYLISSNLTNKKEKQSLMFEAGSKSSWIDQQQSFLIQSKQNKRNEIYPGILERQKRNGLNQLQLSSIIEEQQ